MAVNDSQGRAAGMNLPDASGFLMPEGQQGFGQIEQCLLVTGDVGLVRGNLQLPGDSPVRAFSGGCIAGSCRERRNDHLLRKVYRIPAGFARKTGGNFPKICENGPRDTDFPGKPTLSKRKKRGIMQTEGIPTNGSLPHIRKLLRHAWGSFGTE